MENKTQPQEFHLMLFSANSASLFSFLYIFGVLTNLVVITVIYIDDQLHTPMYLFLCNLALVDICYLTTTVPNLLYMLLSGNNTMSFIQCLTQMYFYLLAASTEDVLIFVMAYDRYVAICNPLHYHSVLNRKNCLFITAAAWITGCSNSLLFAIPVSKVSFSPNTIQQFFCEAIALINTSSSGKEQFYVILYVEILVGLFPVIFSVTSYVKIIRVILQIKSKDGRKKAFSTCSSHLTLVIIYYMTALAVYMMPPTQYSDVLEPVFTVLYSVITPMINPLIYSLRNNDVISALMRILGVKLTLQNNLK